MNYGKYLILFIKNSYFNRPPKVPVGRLITEITRVKYKILVKISRFITTDEQKVYIYIVN